MKMLILDDGLKSGNKEQFRFNSKQCEDFTHVRKIRLEELLQTETLEQAWLDPNLGFQFTNDVE